MERKHVKAPEQLVTSKHSAASYRYSNPPALAYSIVVVSLAFRLHPDPRFLHGKQYNFIKPNLIKNTRKPNKSLDTMFHDSSTKFCL